MYIEFFKKDVFFYFNIISLYLSKFDKETCVKMLKTMVILSKLDTVMYEAQRQGRISFYMPNHGESAAQLGSAHALNPKDLVFAQYREAGKVLMSLLFLYF